ncbi:MAG TPA: thioredoxin domain-containing protein [Gemmatimonadales bacterium]|nr:thioredoxin domain-containing protein [Gemmatimonadales bacterium]HRZ08345.1 thioredoxin domain-containing protein [Gemmatimonadales bacterium]
MAGTSSLNRFYLILLVVAVAGGGLLFWQVRRGVPSIPANVTVTAADTAGFQGYFLGNPDAPVVITEYADYQCPGCQTFDMVQFPDIVRQLVETGKVRWRYRDFPLNSHAFSRLAAHSAACADDQGRYWEQHASIYQGQSNWARETEPSGTFRGYAERIGLDLKVYDECMMSAKYAGRIQASYDEGVRVGVNGTPTFLIGDRLYGGLSNSDALKALVDSLTPATPATP